MNLEVNMLISWSVLDDVASDSYTERILWIDPSSTQIVTIEIFDKHSLPVLRAYDEIAKALDSQKACVCKKDPYIALHRPENKIKAAEKAIRDKRWHQIESLVASNNVDIMINPRKRRQLIVAQVKMKLGCEVAIYKSLRRHWQRGMVKNAQLPDYEKCGAPGKRRVTDDQNGPKLGRKKSTALVTGKNTGIRITNDIKRKFERGIKKSYETQNRFSLTDAFDLTLKQFFWIDFDVKDGLRIPLLPPAEQLPTFRQFQYWYHDEYLDEDRKYKKRYGEGEYNRSSRPMLSNSRQMACGPGYMFQIDSTLSDTHLVSSFDPRRIIGRAVIYSCVDVYSAVITGFCVTLEGPSWLSAMLAIDHIVTDKVAYCAEHDIQIVEEEWPCHHLPSSILADRGEFEGYDADTLPNSLGVTLHNTGPYRPDWKGLVERQFGLAKETVIKFTPGAIPAEHIKGCPDYRLRAALTLYDIRQLLICYALDYNSNHYLKDYRKDEFMIPDRVERYPLEIWKWGLNNGFNNLQSTSREIVRLNLLPRKTVRVTPRGIHFGEELYYTCDRAISEKWFSRARIRGGWKIEVCFDPRNTDLIYIPKDGGKDLEPCYLTDASKHLKGRNWYDVMDYFALERQAKEAAQTRRLQSKAKLHARREQIIGEAISRQEAALTSKGVISNSSRIKGIRTNRTQEKQLERETGLWRFDNNSHSTSPTNEQDQTSENSNNEGYVAPSPKATRIRRHRNKGWQKDAKR